eukprot:CAMPEP_0172918896 /NCGR_PEP_ID=MMETSP1075-20121228/201070_1 /TAXON_ID=2916 /ORGANISM="Ceratium fusus, Strain PA161109" /LENGTH=41 /DNA_ID= /DNA_START= /DNA_END= /DNA_ORIENTATION=
MRHANRVLRSHKIRVTEHILQTSLAVSKVGMPSCVLAKLGQ